MTPGARIYRTASLGDFTEVPQAIDELARSASASDRAWSLALEGLYRMTSPGAEPLGPERLAGHEDSIPLALAARQGVLGAALRFDRPKLDGWIAALERSSISIVRSLAHGWHAVLSSTEALAAPREVIDLDPGLAIEATVQRALVEIEIGDKAKAMALARQASRMAATEGLLQLEYLANVALARIRRRAGSTHLSVRILSSLQAVVPPVWKRWIGWELALAGHVEGGPLEPPVHAIAAGAERFRASLEESAAGVGFAALAREIRSFGSLVDPGVESADARAWLAGSEHETPFGIADPLRDSLSIAYAAVMPGRAPRRVLRVGLPLLGPDAFVVMPSLRGRRAHEALAIVALAGRDGALVQDLFRALYGTALLDITHEEVFRGLVHRMRAEVGHAADIGRAGDRLRLEPSVPVAIPDPRSERSLADRILAFVASRNGRATAREVATALGIPLRTVQRALGTLVEEGACSAEPDGRRTEYVVEDTTFHEPTLHRLRGRGA